MAASFLISCGILAISLSVVESRIECSALNSYVQVLSTALNESETITSAQALFPPYTYHIPYTQVAILNDNDDPCSTTGISTAITGKIALLFESKGSCSNHQKVYVAQTNGAIAVVIANQDPSGGVTTVIDDDSITSSIPMRSIPYQQGIDLESQIKSGEIVEIEFGCFDTLDNYPSHICVLDTNGDRWYTDGVYQRQANWKIHDHPVWKKGGYYVAVGDYYIHLVDPNGDDEWFWGITRAADDWGVLLNDSLVAFCTIGGISEPSLCPLWNITNITTEESVGNYPYLHLTNGLCVEDDADFLCLNSQQSNLVGQKGTYKLYNKATPIWYRQLSDCNAIAAALVFTDGMWIVKDFWSSKWAAFCMINKTLYDESTWDTVQFQPNLCTNWWTVNDELWHGLDPDDTFTIENTVCDLDDCGVATAAPDSICLQKETFFHSYLEGTYVKTGYVGEITGKQEYVLDDRYWDPIYMWFLGEIIPADPSWILSNVSLEEAIDLVESGILFYNYGYCDSDVDNPMDCTAGWRLNVGEYYHDDSVELTLGECVEKTTLEPFSYPSYICIGLKNESLGSESYYLDTSYYVGAYYTDYMSSSGITWPAEYWDAQEHIPIFVKPENDYIGYEVVILYDPVFGIWHIGDENFSTALICTSDPGYTPIDCETWYDLDFIPMSNMYLYECTEDDILTRSPSESPTIQPSEQPTAEPTDASPNDAITPAERESAAESKKNGDGITIIVVMMVLILVGLIGSLLWWFVWKKDTDKGQVSFEHQDEEMIAMDGAGDTNTIPVGQKQVMDMSPLNTETVADHDDDGL